MKWLQHYRGATTFCVFIGFLVLLFVLKGAAP